MASLCWFPKLFIAILIIPCRAATSDASEANGDKLPDVDYMSYLSWPRLHFSGVHRADSASVNNDPLNYDAEHFGKPSPSWNPEGTGEWSVRASVTQVCYSSEVCERVDGVTVMDRRSETRAKMVDLDVQAQSFAEIWGWGLRVGDWFEGDFMPTAFQHPWWKMGPQHHTEDGYGAAYTSVLTNITWLDKENEFVKDIQKYKPERLSIHFNMERYTKDPTSSNFTWGHVTGVVGVSGGLSPPFFVGHGRMLSPRVEGVQNAPFMVDTSHKRVIVDFGNSLPISASGSMNTTHLKTLLVAISVTDSPTFDCSDPLSWLGVVNNKVPLWYEISAGIQAFPGGRLTKEQEELVGKRPLVVVEVEGSGPDAECSRVVLAEHPSGLHVHPFNRWTNRFEAGDTAEFQFVVTHFGREAHGKEIEFQECLSPLAIPDGTPAVGLPLLPESIPPKVKTNKNGIATSKIKTSAPNNNRTYIEGQLYSFCYSVIGGPPANQQSPDDVIVLKVYDEYPDVEFPTWVGHVFPIFKQYANLYPVMTDNFVDLGNYYEVKEFRTKIRDCMRRNITDPRSMPVSRDLSEAKRKLILRWLDDPRLPIGDWNGRYSLRQLIRDLQLALQIEHAAIPPYLTALATIKEGHELEAQEMLRAALVRKMQHMTLLANVLNALGESPKLHYDGFVPDYPAPLPGGVQPRLTLPIERFSMSFIREVFMTIEESFFNIDDTEEYEPEKAPKFGQIVEGSIPCHSGEHSCFWYMHRRGVKLATRRRDTARTQSNFLMSAYPGITIIEFYVSIKEQLVALSDEQHGNMFTGDPEKQIELKHVGSKRVLGNLFSVTNSSAALAAIDEVINERKHGSLSDPDSNHRRNVIANLDEKEVNEDHVWPMIKNPTMADYKPGSAAELKASKFNEPYSRFLKALEDAFGGRPENMRNAFGLMHSVELFMKDLVRTAVDDDGDAETGPNAGPSFAFVG